MGSLQQSVDRQQNDL